MQFPIHQHSDIVWHQPEGQEALSKSTRIHPHKKKKHQRFLRTARQKSSQRKSPPVFPLSSLVGWLVLLRTILLEPPPIIIFFLVLPLIPFSSFHSSHRINHKMICVIDSPRSNQSEKEVQRKRAVSLVSLLILPIAINGSLLSNHYGTSWCG